MSFVPTIVSSAHRFGYEVSKEGEKITLTRKGHVFKLYAQDKVIGESENLNIVIRIEGTKFVGAEYGLYKFPKNEDIDYTVNSCHRIVHLLDTINMLVYFSDTRPQEIFA